MKNIRVISTVLYIFSGREYILVGLDKQGEFTPFTGDNFSVKIGEDARDFWDMYPGIGDLFHEEIRNERGILIRKFRSGFLAEANPQKSIEKYAKGLKDLFKIDLKILPPQKDIFSAFERVQIQNRGFKMTYSLKNGKLKERAKMSYPTSRGWAIFLSKLAKDRGLDSSIESLSEFHNHPFPMMEQVYWNITVDCFSASDLIYYWIEEIENGHLHIAIPTWGEPKQREEPRPVIVRIPRMGRMLTCFLDKKSLGNLKKENVVNQEWLIEVILPPYGNGRAGWFTLKERLKLET